MAVENDFTSPTEPEDRVVLRKKLVYLTVTDTKVQQDILGIFTCFSFVVCVLTIHTLAHPLNCRGGGRDCDLYMGL